VGDLGKCCARNVMVSLIKSNPEMTSFILLHAVHKDQKEKKEIINKYCE
jgi:hypothetical protein